MIKEKISEKLNEKKWYVLALTKEGEYLTTLRIPTFDRVSIKDKKLVTIKTDDEEVMSGHMLNLSKEEAMIFKTTYKNYIVLFREVEDDIKAPVSVCR